MAADSPCYIPGLQAAGDQSSDQYKFVEPSGTDNRLSVCNAATDEPLGVQYNAPSAAGDGLEVAALAPGTVVKVKVASGGVTAGNVGTDNAGLLVNKSTAGDFVVGKVLKSWASGDYAEVHPLPQRLHA